MLMSVSLAQSCSLSQGTTKEPQCPQQTQFESSWGTSKPLSMVYMSLYNLAPGNLSDPTSATFSLTY